MEGISGIAPMMAATVSNSEISDPVMNTRFPNELLSEIFIVSITPPIKSPPPLRDSDLPWAFLRVCKKWRQIALETPDLWNDVLIDYDEGSNMFISENMLERTVAAEKILKRTNDSNISLTIRALGYYDIDEWKSRIFNLIILEASRLKSLTILFNTMNLEPFFRFEGIHFPFLESLTINDCHAVNAIDMSVDIPGLTPQPFEVSVWKNTPNLRTFYLGVNVSWRDNLTSLPWAQLTDVTLRVTKLSVAEAHAMLHACSNVISLKITPGVLEHRNRPPEDIPVHLPYLTHLTVEFYCGDELPIFLQHLVVPRLCYLSVRYPTFIYEDPDWNASLIPIFSRFTELESLACRNRVPLNNTYILLATLSTLKALLLPNRTALSQADLTGLEEGTLLPNLEFLCCTVRPQSLEAHLKMLQGRGARPGGTTRVFAIFNWYIDREVDLSNEQDEAMDENSQLIEALKQDGLLDLVPPGAVFPF